MGQIDSNYIIIAGASVIILSYLFNLIGKKTSIPSVLMLIFIGALAKYVLHWLGMDLFADSNFNTLLSILGTVGLILIVLEASLDLELKKEKLGLITKSFMIALFGLFLTTAVIAVVIYMIIEPNWIIAIMYSIPLSIISSAIVMPSIGNLTTEKKEFLIYESAFSDILGIMLFYFFKDNLKADSTGEVLMNIGGTMSLTLILSIILGYVLIVVLQKLTSHVKFFLLISVLFMIYSVGKLMHLSPLLAIMFFGLMINNKRLFFRGFLRKFIQEDVFKGVLDELKLMTFETAFLVRTFFFFIFGISIDLISLANVDVIIISVLILAVIYLVRIGLFSAGTKGLANPAQFVSPRGLITILLFFQIPKEYVSENFQSGILLVIIILTSVVMTVALIRNKKADARAAKLSEAEKDPSLMDMDGGAAIPPVATLNESGTAVEVAPANTSVEPSTDGEGGGAADTGTETATGDSSGPQDL